jgi:hypothetical protein
MPFLSIYTFSVVLTVTLHTCIQIYEQILQFLYYLQHIHIASCPDKTKQKNILCIKRCDHKLIETLTDAQYIRF